MSRCRQTLIPASARSRTARHRKRDHPLGTKYTAALHFSEQFFGPDNPGQGGEGSRLFDVYCNGVALLRDFDIFKSAGGDNRAVTKTFTSLVPNAEGKLVFEFVPVRNYATLNAIEVEQQ